MYFKAFLNAHVDRTTALKISMATRQSLATPLLFMLFIAQPCPANQKSSKCVRKVCVANTPLAATRSNKGNLELKYLLGRKATTPQTNSEANSNIDDCKREGGQGAQDNNKHEQGKSK